MIKKFLRQYLLSRQERFYLKNRWHFFFDLALVVIIIILITILATLASFRPAMVDTSGPDHQPKISKPSPIDISNPPLAVEFKVKNKVLSSLQTATLSIEMQNNGDAQISDLSLELSSLDNDFSISRLVSPLESKDGEISGSTVSQLDIAAKSSRSLDLEVAFKNKQAGKRLVRWQASITYRVNGQSLKQIERLPDLLRAAEISLKTSAFYTSPQGDQLGSGPMPPVVGLPTRYWIFWEASSQADMENLVVSAKLPPSVTLTDQQAVLNGELSFQPDSRQIIWKVPQIKAEEGPVRLSFALEIIPTASQAGKEPLLLERGRYIAHDVLSGEKIDGQFKEISTDLTDDKLNSGRGQVISQENE